MITTNNINTTHCITLILCYCVRYFLFHIQLVIYIITGKEIGTLCVVMIKPTRGQKKHVQWSLEKNLSVFLCYIIESE